MLINLFISGNSLNISYGVLFKSIKILPNKSAHLNSYLLTLMSTSTKKRMFNINSNHDKYFFRFKTKTTILQ